MSTTRSWLAAAGACAAIGCASVQGCAARDARADNALVARRVFDEILSRGRYEAARELYAPDFVNHALGRDVDLAEDQAAARGWREAMPDLAMTPVRVVAEGDLVTVLWSARGTNTGQGNGLPATGRRVEGRGITIWRIESGRIKEEWSEFDVAALMKQLGLGACAAAAAK